MGGFMRPMPFIGAAVVMAMMAGCGLPGFANFVGEALVLFGSWKTFPLITSLAVWGALVIGGVYMLRAIRNIAHGPVAGDAPKLTDTVSIWRKTPFALLIASLLILGIYPALLTDKIKPSAESILAMANGDNLSLPKSKSNGISPMAPVKKSPRAILR